MQELEFLLVSTCISVANALFYAFSAHMKLSFPVKTLGS